jgi:hypothetical protein
VVEVVMNWVLRRAHSGTSMLLENVEGRCGGELYIGVGEGSDRFEACMIARHERGGKEGLGPP